ncbi:hypothetical protein RZS08_12810, partial [Arthrospira platensis SPKY1]|nr:hypothetical protein [Arthrospira platensis SPKY1]
RVEFGLATNAGELFEPPAFHLAAGGGEGIFRGGGVRIPRLLEDVLLAAALPFRGRRTRAAPLERPVAGEFFQRRAKAGEIEVHAANAGFLELADPRAHGLADARFHVFPIQTVGAVPGRARAADQEDGAVGGGLVLDVQRPFGFGVDRPGGGDG